MLDAEASIAEYAVREGAGDQLTSTRARAEHLRTQVKGIEKELAQKRTLLARRTARHEELETRRESAQKAYEATLTRVRETQAAVGYRGERLQLIDPGIVPERPASPSFVLNTGSAVLAALVLSLSYVSFGFAYSSGQRVAQPLPVRRVGRGHD